MAIVTGGLLVVVGVGALSGAIEAFAFVLAVVGWIVAGRRPERSEAVAEGVLAKRGGISLNQEASSARASDIEAAEDVEIRQRADRR